MEIAAILDMEAVRRACHKYGVERLRIFGSAVSGNFDSESSDIDFLVTFLPQRENLFNDYFDLKFELEHIAGRNVDLLIERSIKNPFIQASATGNARDLYAA
ncbi:nucleotidyltransferase family protein [Microbacterium sp. YY-01]|uniref:nucleotidyltransferase family protein n=1 Tax=Microbacterium sp. YY-01 TaxID=3421634 RepID=UPI003D1785E5